jgi:5-methylcytosine-specific restriction protein A
MSELPADIAPIVEGLRARRARFMHSSELPRREKGCCTWCAGPVPKGRRTWCSQACVDAFLVRNNAGDAARLLRERDGGVCADCGWDFEWLAGRLRRTRGDSWRRRRLSVRVREGLKSRGYDPVRRLWEVEHTVPVIFGGGVCGPEGLETVCQVCHKKRTAALAAERARERAREAGRPEQVVMFG